MPGTGFGTGLCRDVSAIRGARGTQKGTQCDRHESSGSEPNGHVCARGDAADLVRNAARCAGARQLRRATDSGLEVAGCGEVVSQALRR